MTNKLQNSNFATKTDLQQLEKRLEEKIEGLEKNLGTKLDKIANTLDGFVGRVDDLTIDNQVGTNQIREIRDSVDEHEMRIRAIESSRPQ